MISSMNNLYKPTYLTFKNAVAALLLPYRYHSVTPVQKPAEEIIVPYCENHTKHTDTVSARNV
jgi:hypothetical protein